VQNTPALKRDSGFGSLNIKINDNTTSLPKAGLVVQQHRAVRSAGAALGIPLSSALYKKYVAPYLTRLGMPADATVNSVTMNLRLVDAGGRADEYKNHRQARCLRRRRQLQGHRLARRLHPLGKQADRHRRRRLHEPERLRRAGRGRQVRSVCGTGHLASVLARPCCTMCSA
jgi:hypothetical protein